MTIWEIAANALAPLATPMAANVYIPASGSDYPDLYLVYRLISGSPEQHADNVEKSRSYTMQVSAYSRTGLAGLPNVPGAMVAAGFTRGPERELPYSQQTRHFGLALEFTYLHEE